MSLFNLVARLGLDADGYNKGVSGAMAKGVLLGNMLTDLVKKGASMGASLVKTGLTYNQQMEDYTTNFKVMLGSLTAAESKVDELKVMAAKTPFAMEDLADATQTLLAFGVESSRTTDVMSKLGDISLGNAQRFSSLSNAYGKAAAQGKLTGEVVQMMVDAGFNPLLLIAQETGEAMTDLQKRMSAGRVSVDELDLALRRATSEGGQFYKGMEEASRTLSGQLSTLEDNWNALLGEAMSPVSEQLSGKILPTAIESLDKLSAALFGVKEDASGARQALFLNSAGEGIDPSANLLTWVSDLMTEWTNGETEDDATVTSFIESFNENSNAIKTALQTRIDDMSNPMTPEEMETAKQKIADITAMQAEVETLLQKRAGGYITAEEEARLNTIIATLQTMQTELEAAAGFDENIVTPWERFVSAAGDASVETIDAITNALMWCVENGDKVEWILGVAGTGIGVIAGVMAPIPTAIGAVTAAVIALIVEWDNLTASIQNAIDKMWEFLGAHGDGYATDYSVQGYGQISGNQDVFSGKVKLAGGMLRSAKAKPYATGLDYVPYNEYPALLHEGEAVLTKAEAKTWRSGEGGADNGVLRDLVGSVRDLIDAVKASPTVLNVNGRTLAYATAGDNVRAANDRARDINIGKVR